MDCFPPQLLVATIGAMQQGEHQHQTSKVLPAMAEGQRFTVAGINGRVLHYYPSATMDMETHGIVAAKFVSGYSAAEIELTPSTGKKKTDWLIASNQMQAPQFIAIDDQHWMYMTVPSPKAFRSQLVIGKDRHATVAVNQPLRVGTGNCIRLLMSPT